MLTLVKELVVSWSFLNVSTSSPCKAAFGVTCKALLKIISNCPNRLWCLFYNPLNFNGNLISFCELTFKKFWYHQPTLNKNIGFDLS